MHLLEDRMKHSARRTFEIAKLFNVNRRIRWSKYVRGLCSGNALNDWLLLLRRGRAWRS